MTLHSIDIVTNVIVSWYVLFSMYDRGYKNKNMNEARATELVNKSSILLTYWF